MDYKQTLAGYLAKLLGEIVSLKFVAQGYHWNVRGINFHQFHDFFGDIYSDVDGSIDPVAENIRKLNFESPFTLNQIASLATPARPANTPDPMAMCISLYEMNENVRKCLVKAMVIAEECGEQGILNFLADRFDAHSKWQWQLRSIVGDSIADSMEIDTMAVWEGYEDTLEEPEEMLTKADLKVGDFVRWNASGGKAQGKIIRIMRDGKLNVPDSDFSVEGTEENPALLIQIYQESEKGWVATDTKVGHKADTVNAISDLAKAESYVPPKAVQEEAQRALNWMKEGHAGANFTDVGRRRASQLANGQAVSLDTIRRMNSYLARHKVDAQGQGFDRGEKGYPSAGRVAWAAWGGDPAISWVRGILDGVENE